ncbi:choice-of-anchor D domain-containing protein, partial [bacterium]|nr:choice-of-anchor D domain-containing protein [bacterium]
MKRITLLSLSFCFILAVFSSIAFSEENEPFMKEIIIREIDREEGSISTMASQPDLLGFYGPDYSMSSNYRFDVTSSSVYWGNSVEVLFYVGNLGSADAGSYDITFYLSTDSSIGSGGDYALGTYTMAALPSYQFSGATATLYLPSNPFGSGSSFYLGVVIDSNNDVSESNESNNHSVGQSRDYDTVTVNTHIPDIKVEDSSGSATDLTINYPDTVADGSGNSKSLATVEISNTGLAALIVYANGIYLGNGTNFKIESILSSTQDLISLSSSRVIARESAETWIVTVSFDPTLPGSLSDTLYISTDDPDESLVSVSLSGNATPLPDLRVFSGGNPLNDMMINFGKVANDGSGNNNSIKSFTLQNLGTGDITVEQNGIFLNDGVHFAIQSISSNTAGAINLSTGSKVISAFGAEIWTIQVECDPIADGPLTDMLKILTDDQEQQETIISLTCTGLIEQNIQISDSSIDFGGTHADGIDGLFAIETITVSNGGEVPLVIPSNGITLSNSDFQISSVSSDKLGILDISNVISIEGDDVLTLEFIFDPETARSYAATVSINSNDLDTPMVNVNLTGSGLDESDILLSIDRDGLGYSDVTYDATLCDGTGNYKRDYVFTIKNLGTQPLNIPANGISISTSEDFSIVSVISDTQGTIDAGSANQVAVSESETWQVTVAFDPNETGSKNAVLAIQSDDPGESLIQVNLLGESVLPTITILDPNDNLWVNADEKFNVKWDDYSPTKNCDIALYFDPDLNPDNENEILIIDQFQSDGNIDEYSWLIPNELADQSYYLLAIIYEGQIQSHNYSQGLINIEPADSFEFLSSVHVSTSNYVYQYKYKGIEYSGSTTLIPGLNSLVIETPDGQDGTVRHVVKVTYYDHTQDSQQYTYDELNRIKTFTNGNGIISTYNYDMIGRLVNISFSTGKDFNYTYDILGRVLSANDNNEWTFFEYDDLGRVTKVVSSKDSAKSSSDMAVAYEYNKVNLTAVVYPSGRRVEHDYDNAGRLEFVRDIMQTTRQTSYSYDPNTGLLSGQTYPNGMEVQYLYDNSARLETMSYLKDSQLLKRFHYVFDNGGRRTELHTTSPDGLGGFITSKEKYVYDDRSQIKEVQYSDDDVFDPNDRIVSYDYDDNGNRINMQVFEDQNIVENTYYYYGHENRLLRTIDTVSNLITNYQYDPAGNCIRKTNSENDIQYSWDEQNLLLRIQSVDNDIWFEYNAKGIRTAKIINGVRTEYTVEQLSPIFETLEEYDNSGDLLASYTYGTKRIGRYDSAISEYEYYLTDALGSTKMLTDGLGQAVNEYQYDIFGQHGNLSFNPYTFAGQYCDAETGLIFLRARYYDPATGRFISKDPMGVSAGLNHYVYCGNNPVNHFDPLGLDSYLIFVGGDSEGFSDRAVKYESDRIKALSTYNPTEGGIKVLPVTMASQMQNALGSNKDIAVMTYIGHGGQDYITLDPYAKGAETNITRHGGALVDFKDPSGNVFLTDISHSTSIAALPTQNMTSDVDIRLYSCNANKRIENIGRAFADHFDAPVYGPGFNVKFNENTGKPYVHPAAALFYGFHTQQPLNSSVSVGGVLIDKAAVLIGENLSDIKGATYDPASGQIIFLGTQDPAVVDNLDMDYFYTALNSVFGSAVPPFVTLDPPASIHGGRWIDFGDGDGIWEPGEEGGIIIKYTPIWVTEDDDLDIRFYLSSGVDFTAKIESVIKPNISVGERSFVDLELVGWEDKPSDISSDSMPQGSNWINCMKLRLSSSSQESYYVLKCSNNGSSSYIMDFVMALSAKQHRKYGGRIEGTKLGWVMYEADRVMKCLGIGIDNLTGDVYDSSSISIPNYQNCVERMIATGEDGGNIRFWFVPNEMKLQRSIDSVTGKATIVFEEASIELKTESMMMGLPQSPIARDFADHFNIYYDDFAELEFPVQSPDNPEVIINVKIFKRLREAMQAVSLARFFRDNDIPVDMWWLNNWQPPYASSAKTIASAYREVSEGGRHITICGGVNINKPNTYIPSPEAESIGQLVTSSRTPVGDQEVQSWDVDSTSIGDLKAVAASVDAVEQDKSILLAETDLTFASPGRQHLRFARFYDSAITSAFDGMGAGWRNTRYVLQFSRPSWFDENDLMRNSSGDPIGKDSQSNTKLRSGEIRFYDRATGQSVDFMSSLKLEYNVDGLGHPVIELSGLNASDTPIFSPGIRRNGSTLSQDGDKNYTLTLLDGSELKFDCEGRIQTVTDNLGYTITYVYDNSQLISIDDSADQSIVLDYQNDLLDSVTGPASERVEYSYTSGCLVEAKNMRNNGIVSYSYNPDKQLVGSVGIDGIQRLSSVPDLRGRSDQRQDVFGNIFDSSFTTNETTLERTTTTVDTNSAEYSAVQQKFDSTGRLLESVDPFGNTTQIGYYGDSSYPNTIVSPIPGRSPISIDRNSYGQPSRITDPELIAEGAHPKEITYNEKNLPEQVVNPAGQITLYEYNTAGDVNNITITLDGQDIVTRYEYNAEGYLEDIIDPNGVCVASYEYDSLGRVLSQFDSANIETTYVYDS